MIKKKATIIGMWTGFIALPIIGLVVMYFRNILAEYQKARIQAFLTNSGDANYLTATVRSFLKTNKMIGDIGSDIIGSLPGFNTDYILVYLSSTYGTIVSTLVFYVLSVLIIMIWGTALKQKNHLASCGRYARVKFL